MLPNAILNDRGMSKILMPLESDCLSLIEGVRAIAHCEGIWSNGCLVYLECLAFLTNCALNGRKNMANIARR
jgi:hypothetical protein